MFRRHKKNLLWLLLLVAIVVAVGTAFTAANTFDAHAGNQLGYGSQAVSPVNVSYMDYTLDTTATLVDTVTFRTDGDLTLGAPQEHGYVNFDIGGGPGTAVDCGTGTYNVGGNYTQFVCDVTSLADAARTVHDITHTNVAVANGN